MYALRLRGHRYVQGLRFVRALQRKSSVPQTCRKLSPLQETFATLELETVAQRSYLTICGCVASDVKLPRDARGIALDSVSSFQWCMAWLSISSRLMLSLRFAFSAISVFPFCHRRAIAGLH